MAYHSVLLVIHSIQGFVFEIFQIFIKRLQKITFSRCDCNKKQFVPINNDQIMVRRRYDRLNVFRLRALLMTFKEIIAKATRYNTLPVFLHEDVT